MPQRLDYRRREKHGQSPAPQYPWFSRGVLLLAMIMLPLVGVWLYVGPAWANVFLRLGSDGGVVLLWLLAASGFGLFVLRTVKLSDGGNPPALRFAATAAVGLGLFSLATLGFGLIGALNFFTAWGMLIVGWLLGAWTCRTSARDALQRFRSWLKQPAGWSWLFLLAAPFMTVALTAAMAPPGMLWTPEEPHGYDVLEYHLQIPREWFEAHRIVPLHHNVFSYFPFNVEMHYLLAMHLRGGPWAGMYVAQLMHLIFFALTVAAVYGLARKYASPASATIAMLSLFTVPWITQLAGIAYDEGGFLLFGTLSIGFALFATFEPAHRLRRFALAGAMAGFAAGTKLTAVPEVLIAVPIVAIIAGIGLLLSRRKKEAGFHLWIGIAIFGLAGLLAFSPWLIRNMAWASNPVFPEMMPLLGHDDFTPIQVQRFERAHKPPPAQQKFAARLATLNREVLGWRRDSVAGDSPSSAWQFGYLISPLALIALLISFRRPESWWLFGLLVLLTVFWLLMTHLQSRFFILAAPIAALLAATIDWKRGALAGALLIAIFAAIGWLSINARLSEKLYGSARNPVGIVSVLGADGAWLYEQILPVELPKTGTIVLIGDARAFVYPIPMSRIRYRTVFNVTDGAQDIVHAWEGGYSPADGDYLLIDPAELRRFHQTYFGLPPLPPDIGRAGATFIVKQSDLNRE